MSGEDGRGLSRLQRLASALIQHPYTRSTLVRRTLFSAALAVLWLIAAFTRLSASGGGAVTGFLFFGAVFFGVRTVAHVVMLRALPPDEEASKRSGNDDDS